jgi:hypothetical protein
MSKIEVNAIEPQCGTTLTLGASGDTLSLPSGVTLSGVGTVSWDTTAKTTGFTAVSGNGYFVNTTSGAITVTLPAGSAGSIVSLKDYANTWQTNNVTVTPNGTDKINGVNENAILNTQDQSVTLVYVDSTKGWRAVQDSTSDVSGTTYMVATGGTVTCCGDYKIHTFTGPGTFTVCSIGSIPTNNVVDYLVVAGGGGGGGAGRSGGAGAGGFRESSGSASGCYTASPLGACVSALPVTAQGYPITVGSGGSGGIDCRCSPGVSGSNSIFSTITSAGGGGGAPLQSCQAGIAGGSGGGHGSDSATQGGNGGAGNTPPVSPPQGNSGGNSPAASNSGAGGGGATVAGANATPGGSLAGSPGGNGATTSISASPTAYAGGGGGGGNGEGGGSGGTGGGGDGSSNTPADNAGSGTANTGGGGGGGGDTGAAGGSGIVIIRYKYQ